MDWREKLLTCVGPGLLGGATFGDWIKLLRDQNFAVDFKRLPRALSITIQSLKNSIWARFERRRFGPLLHDIKIVPPLFVLGHWRNGTTHLHQLIAQDHRFAFPNGYQTAFPHTFLTTEAKGLQRLSPFVPKQRPMDNVEWTLASPQEDEFALCASTFKSPCMSWIFPRNRGHFQEYMTFRNAAPAEVNQWRAAFESFLKKLTWKYRRRLVLKSPPHTCRIRLLLEMFPGAQFVHIHRDPYVVFQSTRKTFETMFKWQGLQRPDLSKLEDWILDQYRAMYEVFFEERNLIPSGCFHELAFEDLEKDPIAQLRSLYEALHLPNFTHIEPKLRRYVESLAGYQKNRFPRIGVDTKVRIAREWQHCFEAWGYST